MVEQVTNVENTGEQTDAPVFGKFSDKDGAFSKDMDSPLDKEGPDDNNVFSDKVFSRSDEHPMDGPGEHPMDDVWMETKRYPDYTEGKDGLRTPEDAELENNIKQTLGEDMEIVRPDDLPMDEAWTEVQRSPDNMETNDVPFETGGADLESSIKQTLGEDTEMSLRDVANKMDSSELKDLCQKLDDKFGKEFTDKIAVHNEDGKLTVEHKEALNTKMEIQGDTILVDAGSNVNNGEMNQFMNYCLPDKEYIVDGVAHYKTDHLGRVTECECNRNKMMENVERNPQRNSDVQNEVRSKGKETDDGGHLFSNTTNGANEALNQVPMDAETNRTGSWRDVERMEEKALDEGKEVISKRKLLYEGDSTRPYAIEVTDIIDGKEIKYVIPNP